MDFESIGEGSIPSPSAKINMYNTLACDVIGNMKVSETFLLGSNPSGPAKLDLTCKGGKDYDEEVSVSCIGTSFLHCC